MIIFLCLFMALLEWGGSRLENAADRMYCGQEIAKHNLKKCDKRAICWLVAAIVFTIIFFVWCY